MPEKLHTLHYTFTENYSRRVTRQVSDSLYPSWDIILWTYEFSLTKSQIVQKNCSVLDKPYDCSAEAELLYALIVKAQFENNRYQKPKKKQPESSTKHVDWLWSWSCRLFCRASPEPQSQLQFLCSAKCILDLNDPVTRKLSVFVCSFGGFLIEGPKVKIHLCNPKNLNPGPMFEYQLITLICNPFQTLYTQIRTNKNGIFK